jgi:filamin
MNYYENRAQNCSQSMTIAQTDLNVPMILTPEDLSNPNLDERSGLTYLSYFMKEDGPGYKSTLTWVQKTLPHCQIKNLSVSYNKFIHFSLS